MHRSSFWFKLKPCDLVQSSFASTAPHQSLTLEAHMRRWPSTLLCAHLRGILAKIERQLRKGLLHNGGMHPTQ